jgi:hypothetical protein
MLHEPLPIFDCMYCVKDSMKVFQRVAERLITQKYACATNLSKESERQVVKGLEKKRREET